MFSDIVVGRDGQPLHPMEGDLHFRVCVGLEGPEVLVELPVRVGNRLSSWSYRVTLSDWVNLVDAVNKGILGAEQYLQEARR